MRENVAGDLELRFGQLARAEGTVAMTERYVITYLISVRKRHMALESKPPVQSVIDDGERQMTGAGRYTDICSSLGSTRGLLDSHEPV